MTPEQRHKNMSAIRGKDTKPEIVVRKYLWSHGFRYRLNSSRLPGKPDIVLSKYRTCVFVNGCFWHGHGISTTEVVSDARNANDTFMAAFPDLQNSECCKIPKTNRAFWVQKIMRNKERDIEVKQKLAKMGWHSMTIWECELKSSRRNATLESLVYTLNKIFLQDRSVRKYEHSEDDEYRMVAETSDTEYGKRK